MISSNSFGSPAGRACHRVDQLLLLRGIRRLADLAGGELRVLLVDRAQDVRRRELQLREAVGPQPDPHRVVLRAEDLNVGGARQPLQLVEHVHRHEVRDVQVVEAAVRRVEGDHLQERTRALLDHHALPPHFLGQPRLGLLDAVVDVERGLVDVGADVERDLDLDHAVRRRVAAHVEHAFDAVDRVLERRGHGLLEHLRRRAGVDRAHADHRRRDLGVLRDRSTRIAARPASTMKIDSTTAKMGRSMKKRENMGRCPCLGPRARAAAGVSYFCCAGPASLPGSPLPAPGGPPCRPCPAAGRA